MILFHYERFDEAVPYFENAIKYAPTDEGPYANLSQLYFSKGEYEKSIAINERAIAANPKTYNPLSLIHI